MTFDQMAIGVDIESIARFDKAAIRSYDAFLQSIYTDREIKYCLSKAYPAQHFAVRYAAKEAVVKALTAFHENDIDYKEIEILNNSELAPEIHLKRESMKGIKSLLSLSHDRDKAIASVILLKT